jgi:hypothetical protein
MFQRIGKRFIVMQAKVPAKPDYGESFTQTVDS